MTHKKCGAIRLSGWGSGKPVIDKQLHTRIVGAELRDHAIQVMNVAHSRLR